MDKAPQETLPPEQVTVGRWLLGLGDRLYLAIWRRLNRKQIEEWEIYQAELARKNKWDKLVAAHKNFLDVTKGAADRSGVELTEVRKQALASMGEQARKKYLQIQAYLDELAKQKDKDGNNG